MLYGDIFSQRLTLVNTHVVADTIDYLEVKFFFKTNDWDGLEKWVHFANSERVYDIRLSEDGVQKEDHLNLTAGKWRVYLHGNRYENGQVIERITTDEAVIYVAPTGALNGEPFPEMPASVTEQILARLEDVEQNGGGSGGGISRETDPTVPDWAKQPEKPKYTSAEVGAVSAEQFNRLSEAKADYASVPNKATVDGSTLKMQRETTTTDEAGTETTETTDLFEVELPSGGDCWTIDELTAETVIANDDAVPFYDTSAKGQRKTLWSNIKAVLKTYFDGVYLKRSGDSMQGTLNLNGNLVMPFGEKIGIRDNTDNPVMRYETINNEASLRLGHKGVRFHVLSSERPMYNGLEFAIKNDIPDTYNKAQIDAIVGSYVNDIDELIGGDA